MRSLIATVFNYSLDGFMSDPGTDFSTFCFDQPENQQPDDPTQREFLRSASAHVFGRVAYEDMSQAMTRSPDHPFASILEEGRKVVFSTTMTTAGWANTTIASGETAQEVARLKEGGDGHVIVWGGVRLWAPSCSWTCSTSCSSACSPTSPGRAPACSTASPRRMRSSSSRARPHRAGSSSSPTAARAEVAPRPTV